MKGVQNMNKKKKTNRQISYFTATNCKVISFSKRIVRGLLKTIPGEGITMSVNLSSVNFCKGGCKYCFCAINNKSYPKRMPKHVNEITYERVLKIIKIVHPECITTAEKTELGFDSKAIEWIKRLRQDIPSDIKLIVSTKFPQIYKKLDLPNTEIVVTLSNPNLKIGLEPNIPSIDKRIAGILEAVENVKHASIGVRAVIGDVSEIFPMYNAVKSIRHKINILWIGFLRSGDMAYKIKKFKDAVGDYMNLNNYERYAKYGFTLMSCFISDTIAQFEDMDPVYDRLPSPLVKLCQHAGHKVVTYAQTSRCFIRADNVPCKNSCNSNNKSTCGGRTKGGAICPNLLEMTPTQYEATMKQWNDVRDNRRFAWGTRKNGPRPQFISMMRLLESTELRKHIYR
jgi:hypothetical protein